MGGHTVPAKYTHKFNMNGLSGRMLTLPKPNKRSRSVLLVYGLGSSLERVYPVAKTLNKSAAVIVPDLPGFGGMDGMHKIGMQPSLNNLADYIAALVKLQFPRQRFVIAGLDFGFAVVDRLLRNYPDIAKRVDLVISLAGTTDWRELQMPRSRVYGQRIVSTVLTRQLPSGLTQGIAVAARPRLRRATPDLRTYLRVKHSLLHLKHNGQALKLPVYYFPGSDCLPVDQTRVIEHLKEMYRDVSVVTEFNLTCSKAGVELKPLKKRAALTWLKR